MTKLEFDNRESGLVEEFNASNGAVVRRAKIAQAIQLRPGEQVLDIGSGPGHLAFELSSAVGEAGSIIGIDSSKSALQISQRRCEELQNVTFKSGEATNLLFDASTFDVVLSCQVLEYLGEVDKALAEMIRVLKPGGRVLIHDTDWDTLVWHSSCPERMGRILKSWEGHLANPRLPQTLGKCLLSAGFQSINAEAVVQLELEYDPSSVSAILLKFISGYVVSHGIAKSEVDEWASDLYAMATSNDYFFSYNGYIFTATKGHE